MKRASPGVPEAHSTEQGGRQSILGDRFDKVVLVVSTGRTATKAIAHYFDTCYESVCARHEPFPSRPLRFASNLYLSGRISRSSLRSIMVLCRRHTLAGIAAPVYMETNMFTHGCLDVLDEVLGDVRVCHIVRHPGRQWRPGFTPVISSCHRPGRTGTMNPAAACSSSAVRS